MPSLHPGLSAKPKLYRHFKPRGQFDGQEGVIVASIDISDTSDKPPVPYRLPRISPQTTPRLTTSEEYAETDVSDKMWGRFGYEEMLRIPSLTPSVNKLDTPRISQNPYSPLPGFNQPVPKFTTAAITPRKTLVHNMDIPEKYKVYRRLTLASSLIDRSRLMREDDHPDPTPSPIPRSPSPTKSVKSIHWALGSNQKRQITFDRKGRGRAQGPFSREFTVTCFAPQSWLKLKLGRSKTTLH